MNEPALIGMIAMMSVGICLATSVWSSRFFAWMRTPAGWQSRGQWIIIAGAVIVLTCIYWAGK